jgi:uncharacterized RDD family membrane protein YckC
MARSSAAARSSARDIMPPAQSAGSPAQEPAIVTSAAAHADAPAPPRPYATLRARIGAYVVDMVILSAIIMVVTVIAGFVLLLATDFAEQDPSDPDSYMFLGIIGLGVPIVWALMNVALLATRQQTGGHYVAGVRLARQDAAPLTMRDAAAWFCLGPLLFSWPMAAASGGTLLILTGLTATTSLLVLSTLVVLLCIAMPPVALIAALFDGQNRALHDRIAGTVLAGD